MAKTIELSAPVTLTLSPVEVQIIVLGLRELPYKHAQPVVDHLFEACSPKEAPDGPKS